MGHWSRSKSIYRASDRGTIIRRKIIPSRRQARILHHLRPKPKPMARTMSLTARRSGFSNAHKADRIFAFVRTSNAGKRQEGDKFSAYRYGYARHHGASDYRQRWRP